MVTKEDDIFRRLEYIIYTDCTETGLVLFILNSDSMEIKYNNMDISNIKKFIQRARKGFDCTLLLPIHQYNEDFDNEFSIVNGMLLVHAYEGKNHGVETFTSAIEIQLPFLEQICTAIIECKNTTMFVEKIYFETYK